MSSLSLFSKFKQQLEQNGSNIDAIKVEKNSHLIESEPKNEAQQHSNSCSHGNFSKCSKRPGM